MKITASVMPKSNVGRKAIPVDASAVEFFVENLRENPIQELDDEFRPTAYGPEDHLFVKDSRAQSEGRRYRKAVQEKLGCTVRVTVVDNGVGEVLDEAGKVIKASEGTRYLWKLYIPLAEGMELMDVPADAGTEEASERLAEAEEQDGIEERGRGSRGRVS